MLVLPPFLSSLPAMVDRESPPLHEPVLLAEVIEALAVTPGQRIVDTTLGMGGHAEALLARGARVLALDRDPESIEIARARLARFEQEGQLVVRKADHRQLLAILAEERTGPVDAVLSDLGVSSYQLLSPERGFSFNADAPLDMRMDRTSDTRTAADLVNQLEEAELARLIRVFGEERQARRVARALVRRRESEPFVSTADLAQVVSRAKKRVFGAARRPIHPATLTFQALRIAVNDEISGIECFVEDAVSALRQGGRLAVISFHSLEDRPVKLTLRKLEKGCVCPPELPICACGREPQVRRINRRVIRPGEAECETNPRARSARLRVVEKISHEIHPSIERAA